MPLDAADARADHSGLEETPAAQPASGLSEDELQALDLAYHHKKVSGQIQREREFRALEDQVRDMRCGGAL